MFLPWFVGVKVSVDVWFDTDELFVNIVGALVVSEVKLIITGARALS